MYFSMKNNLKSSRNHTPKQAQRYGFFQGQLYKLDILIMYTASLLMKIKYPIMEIIVNTNYWLLGKQHWTNKKTLQGKQI